VPGRDPMGRPPDAAVLGEEVTISFWHSLSPDTEQGRLLAIVLGEFQDAYPEVSVVAEYRGGPEELYGHTLVAIEEGQPPDLVMGAPQSIAEYARLGAAAPLDALMGEATIGLSPEERADFVPGTLDVGRYPQFGGHYYGFPFVHQAAVMYCNLDLLATAGHQEPPRTPEEFLAAARAVGEASGAVGVAMEGSGVVFQAWLLAQGGGLVSEDYTGARFADEVGIGALRQLARLGAEVALARLRVSGGDAVGRGARSPIREGTG